MQTTLHLADHPLHQVEESDIPVMLKTIWASANPTIESEQW